MKRYDMSTILSVWASIILIVAGCAEMRAASHVNRGIDYSKQGQYDKAISEFNKAIETKPRYTLAYYNRGNAYSNRDQYEKVISDYTKATEINPRYAKPYNNLAWILATCPDAEYREGVKAVELAQKAVELKPKAFCLDTLAAAYAEAGRFEDAITVQEKAIALLKERRRQDRNIGWIHGAPKFL